MHNHVSREDGPSLHTCMRGAVRIALRSHGVGPDLRHGAGRSHRRHLREGGPAGGVSEEA